MSYTKQVWKTGDVISSEKLNHIEDGIVAVEQSIPNIELSAYATIEQLNKGLAEKQPVGDYATTTQLTEGLVAKQPVGDYPVYQKFSAGADPAERKTIQLANADSISGISSTGDGANLIMLSKWNKVDIGSTKYQMNLNSPDGVVQINDDLVVATTKDIDAVTKSSSDQANSMMINKDGQISFSAASKDSEGSQVGIVVNKDAFTILCNYRGSNSTGLNAQVTPSSFIVKTVDAEGSQSSVDLLKAVQPEQLTNLATKDELATKASTEAIADMLTKTEASSTYATKTELDEKADNSELASLASKDELSTKADVSAIADMLTKTEASETYVTKADQQSFNQLMFGQIDWQKYKDSKYATQILTNVEQSFFDDLGNPENINGQPYNAESNNYKVGNNYICFGGFDENIMFHYDLWDVEFDSGLCGQVMTALATALSTQEESTSKSLKDLQDKYTALEARVAALESK